MRLNMHKLKNKFKRLFMSAATIGTACLLAGCGAGAAAGTDNSSVTESQSGVNGSEQENASSDSQKLQIVATIFRSQGRSRHWTLWLFSLRLPFHGGSHGRRVPGDRHPHPLR